MVFELQLCTSEPWNVDLHHNGIDDAPKAPYKLLWSTGQLTGADFTKKITFGLRFPKKINISNHIDKFKEEPKLTCVNALSS